jgi:hypothetical protein
MNESPGPTVKGVLAGGRLLRPRLTARAYPPHDDWRLDGDLPDAGFDDDEAEPGIRGHHIDLAWLESVTAEEQ